MFNLQLSLSISLYLSYQLGLLCNSFISLHFLFLEVNDNPAITPERNEQWQGPVVPTQTILL